MRFWGNYFLTNSCLQTRDDLFELLLDYDNAVLEVRSRGIDLEGLLLQACNQCSLQQTLVKTLKLKNVTPYCPILRLQDKFDRWRLSERGNIACRMDPGARNNARQNVGIDAIKKAGKNVRKNAKKMSE